MESKLMPASSASESPATPARDDGGIPATTSSQVDGASPVMTPDRGTPSAAVAPTVPTRSSMVVRIWAKLRREPSLMFTAAYVLVSFIGLWANFWFYRVFQLPILEYMQASDYLVAGLRDPAYAGIALVMVTAVLLISWPDAWRRNHPQRVEAMRRHWWGRLLFPNSRWMRWHGVGVSPETGIVFGALWGMMWCATFYVQNKAEYIRDHGAGSPVQVTLAGDARPQPGQARLLGTSGAFVFLWWPEQCRAEAVPIEGVGRLRVLPNVVGPVGVATSTPPPMPPAEPVPATKAATSAK